MALSTPLPYGGRAIRVVGMAIDAGSLIVTRLPVLVIFN